MPPRLQLNKVHDYRKMPGTDQTTLVGFNPYIRVNHEPGPPLFIQNGVVFSEGGRPADHIPEWFWEAVRAMPPQARASVKFTLPEEAAQAPVEEEAPKTEELPKRKRGRPRRKV